MRSVDINVPVLETEWFSLFTAQATDWTTPGTNPGRAVDLSLFCKRSLPTLGQIQPPLQCVLGLSSVG